MPMDQSEACLPWAGYESSPKAGPIDCQPQKGGSEQHETRRLGDGDTERRPCDDPWFGPSHRRRAGLPGDRLTALPLVLVIRVPGIAQEHIVALDEEPACAG